MLDKIGSLLTGTINRFFGEILEKKFSKTAVSNTIKAAKNSDIEQINSALNENTEHTSMV